MNKIEFKNLPNTTTPLNAENLNTMQDNIEAEFNNKADIINITTGKEYETGRIIDGKKEYGKRINIGALPNATAKYVNTGLRDITLTDGGIVGSFKNENVQRTYPEGQFSQGVSLGLIMYLSAGGGTLTITCKGDGSILSGYVTLYYTKN